MHLLERVVNCYNRDCWREILLLQSEAENNLESRKISWVWPNEENLKFICNIVKQFKCKGIISVGCGSGLLEWCLHKLLDLPVIGYEINEKWWQSSYSPPKFIPMTFCSKVGDNIVLDSTFAIFFCYFNDGDAFIDYINQYAGCLLFLIGPGANVVRYTDPDVFHPPLDILWQQYSYEQVAKTGDYIVAYTKIIR